MDVGRGYNGSDVMSLLDNSSNSLWLPSSPTPFHETMVKFDQEINQGTRRSHRGTSEGEGEGWGGEEFEMIGIHQPEKKRRLTQEQVQFLEKSFEIENKLEPERKVQLANELGLQPRQVAIWFQNRRARYKTKQLEKDYGSLKSSYDSLKLDFDSLIKERDHLQNEVKLLTKKLKQRETGQSNPDPDTPLNPDPRPEPERKPKIETPPIILATKQADQDASSAKSDVFDSESPHCTEGIHSLKLEDPTQIPDPDMHSDFSQDEEERQLNLLYPTTNTNNSNNNDNGFKVEEEFYNGATNGCSFSFGMDEQHGWSWLY